MTLGAVLCACREARGQSKRQLSMAAGLSPSYVGKVESGEVSDPSFRSIARLMIELDLNSLEIVQLVRQEALRGE